MEQEEVEIPDWQKNLVRKRLDDYRKNLSSAMDFDSAIDEIEKEL
ncbi:addiction module protein [Aquiflexum lacus]